MHDLPQLMYFLVKFLLIYAWGSKLWDESCQVIVRTASILRNKLIKASFLWGIHEMIAFYFVS